MSLCAPVSIPHVLSLNDAEDASCVAAVFDSPHSGTDYPDDFCPALPMAELRKTEDMYIDEIYASAPDYGAALLLARFPRAYIDPNRPADDMDEAVLDAPWPYDLAPSIKSKLGQGLIWRICPPDLPIYDRVLSVAECKARIDGYHTLYHAALQRVLDQRHADFGAVWHVNCHSMSANGSPNTEDGADAVRADVVLGDRDGTTAGADFVAAVEACLKDQGLNVKRNDPYKGVELVRAYSDPMAHRHSLQIEINRRLYMDENSFERTADFAATKAAITRMINVVSAFAKTHA
ncbi:MAG: N-formylglutamate amidohydrolase [Rhodospirillaceae bacterium]|nr:N-formylglutamate amidohydrolase [Rhodospirillaceae bacterium]